MDAPGGSRRLLLGSLGSWILGTAPAQAPKLMAIFMAFDDGKPMCLATSGAECLQH